VSGDSDTQAELLAMRFRALGDPTRLHLHERSASG